MVGPYTRKNQAGHAAPPQPTLVVEFFMGAGRAENLRQIPTSLPEIAMVGRSNVGKSTLINRLFNRKALARVSKTPGRTQEINFFRVNELCMVADLPGYGFARTARNLRNHWDELVQAYFERRCITDLLFLTDARRDLNEEDFAILRHITERANVWVILTKSDKLLQKDRKPAIQNMAKSLAAAGFRDCRILLMGNDTQRELETLRACLFFKQESG